MGAESEVLYEVADHVATVTINREKKRNALNETVLSGLLDSVAKAKADPEVRVLVLTGTGTKAFCAGADLGGMASEGSKVQQHLARGAIVELVDALWTLGKPTIAKVNGHALAGGFGIMCACDIVIASDAATFGMPEVATGLWPFVISVPVRSKIQPAKALELMMTGRRISAEETEALGAINQVVAPDQLDKATAEMAAVLASKAPLSMKLGKDSFYASSDMEPRAAMKYLHTMLGLCVETEDVLEGITAFMQKREPVFKGR